MRWTPAPPEDRLGGCSGTGGKFMYTITRMHFYKSLHSNTTVFWRGVACVLYMYVCVGCMCVKVGVGALVRGMRQEAH